MAKENGKKGIITVSVIAFLLFTGVILFLSLSDYFGGDNDASLSRKASQLDMSSDATPGENNKEVKSEISPKEIQGRYVEEHDGWFYDFVYNASGEFDGTYIAAYDQTHSAVQNNPEKYYSEQGLWKLENGEIKLYINNQYAKSLWSCGDYVIDSRNYFVGYVPKKGEDFQSSFICKAGESGDTQILNFYYDGKMIMEIIANDGEADKSADSASEQDSTNYSVFVGNYTLENDKITVKFIDNSQKVFYIVDDGIAGWVYRKN